MIDLSGIYNFVFQIALVASVYWWVLLPLFVRFFLPKWEIGAIYLLMGWGIFFVLRIIGTFASDQTYHGLLQQESEFGLFMVFLGGILGLIVVKIGISRIRNTSHQQWV